MLLERVEQEVLEGPEDNGRSELRSASDILSREEMEQLFPGKNYEPCTVTDLAELMDIPALKKLNDISPDRLKSCRTLMTDLATGLRFLPHKFHHDINDIPLMFDSAAKHASQQDLEQAGAIMACVASSERQAVAGVAMTVLDTINSARAEHDTGKVIDSHKKFCSAVARKIQDQLPDFHTSINVFTNLFPEEFWPDIFDATPHLLNDLLTSAIINQDMSFLRKLQANNISITEAERVKGESFFQWTYPHEAHDTAALLLDLGADIDAKRPDGTPYFKDSDTFPYDHQIILRADDPRLPIDWSMPLVKKNPRSSTLYTWDMAANSMKKEAGKPRSFTGNYKLVIEAHGNDLLVSRWPPTLLRRTNSAKDKGTDRAKRSIPPKKIAMVSCITGRNIPLVGSFAESLTRNSAALGIKTRVTAPSGVTTVLPSGRKARMTNERTRKLKALSFSKKKTIQTKDDDYRQRMQQKGYQPATGLKTTYWVENGKLHRRKD